MRVLHCESADPLSYRRKKMFRKISRVHGLSVLTGTSGDLSFLPNVTALGNFAYFCIAFISKKFDLSINSLAAIFAS